MELWIGILLKKETLYFFLVNPHVFGTDKSIRHLFEIALDLGCIGQPWNYERASLNNNI